MPDKPTVAAELLTDRPHDKQEPYVQGIGTLRDLFPLAFAGLYVVDSFNPLQRLN